MSDLIPTDAKRDLYDFQAADFLAECGVETGSTLFDKSKVKAGDIGDGLDVIVTGKVGVGSTAEITIVARDGGNVVSV